MFNIFPIFFDFLLTDKKSSERKIPFTPFIDKIFLISSLEVCFFSVNSTGPSNETFSPGKNFSEFGFGVFKVCTNISMYIDTIKKFLKIKLLKTNDFF